MKKLGEEQIFAATVFITAGLFLFTSWILYAFLFGIVYTNDSIGLFFLTLFSVFWAIMGTGFGVYRLLTYLNEE